MSSATGRELSFAGAVGVRVWPHPALVLTDVRFANAPWGSQPWMAQVGRATADIDWWALLWGKLHIERIAITDASVLVETDRDGNGNWVLGSSDSAMPTGLGFVEIDELAVQPLAFTYRDGATGKTTSIPLDSVRIAAPSASRPIDVDARGAFAGKGVEASATIGGLAALLEGKDPYPVRLDVKLETGTLQLRGEIARPLDLAGLHLDLAAQGGEFADLAAAAGRSLAPVGPYHFAARVSGSVAAPDMSGIDLAVGSADRMELRARGSAAGRTGATGALEIAQIDLALDAQGAELGELARITGASIPAAGRYRMAARLTGSWITLGLSDIEATVGSAGGVEINVRGSIGKLREAAGIDLAIAAAAKDWWTSTERSGALRLPPFALRGRMRDAPRGYRVDGLDLRVADSRVNADVMIVRGGARPRVTGRLHSPLIDLSRIASSEEPPPPVPAGGAAATRGSVPIGRVDVALDVTLDRIVLSGGRLVQSVSGRVALEDGSLSATALQASAGGARIRVDGHVAEPLQAAGLDLTLAVQGAELAALMKFFGKPVASIGPYRGTARAKGSVAAPELRAIEASAGRRGQRIQLAGRIGDVRRWTGLDLAAQLEAADSVAAGRLFGRELPRLPQIKVSARISDRQGDYALDDLEFAVGRTAVKGRIAFTPGEPRPRVTARLSGPLVALDEVLAAPRSPPSDNPLLAADIDAEIRIDRLVLADKRRFGPVGGRLRLAAGELELQQFGVAVDGASATFDGRIRDPLNAAGIDLKVTTQSRHLAGVETLAHIDLPELPPFTASGRLVDVPGGYAVSGLALAFGKSTFHGDTALTRAASRYKLSAKLASPHADLGELMPQAPATPSSPDGRKFSDRPLPLGILRVIDADLDVHVETLSITDGTPLGPSRARVRLTDGRLTADPARIVIREGQTIGVTGTIDASARKGAAWALKVEGRAIDLGEALARLGHPGMVTGGAMDLVLEFTGRGESVRAVLGSLDGEAQVKVGPGRFHNFDVTLGAGVIQGMVEVMNPFRKTDPYTDVKCAAARVPIKGGVVTSDRNVAVETAKFNAVSSGTVNLRTEAIDIALLPIVTQGLGIGSGQITRIARLRGTLANPALEIDPISAVKSATSLGAAVATFGGWWIAEALLKKAQSDPHPCATALRESP